MSSHAVDLMREALINIFKQNRSQTWFSNFGGFMTASYTNLRSYQKRARAGFSIATASIKKLLHSENKNNFQPIGASCVQLTMHRFRTKK